MNHIIPLIVVICLLLPIVGGFRAPSLRPAPAVATSIRTASSPGSRLYAYEVIDSIDATFVSQLTGCAGLIFAGQWYDSRPEELVAPSTPLASPSSKQVIDFTKNSESMFEDEKEVDIYRDTALRYAGYLVSLSQISLFHNDEYNRTITVMLSVFTNLSTSFSLLLPFLSLFHT